jgi:hypothetical protein
MFVYKENLYTYSVINEHPIYEFSLQWSMQIYTGLSIYKHYFRYNEQPINFLSLILYDYYTYSNQGFNTDNCLFFVYVSSDVYTVTIVTAVQCKRLI